MKQLLLDLQLAQVIQGMAMAEVGNETMESSETKIHASPGNLQEECIQWCI